MACEKLSLSAIPSKSEKHAPAQHMDGPSDHDCRIALDQWQAHIGRLRILVEHSDEFTPPAFVKSLDESLPELRRAAMEVLCTEKRLTECNHDRKSKMGGI